ncbi:MAG: sugar phosphate nucleotidyltransferase [Pseudomonadota bacterium]|nr:sugar phosphate nucleotidyltransferase [Pseudomonadota bacterium]
MIVPVILSGGSGTRLWPLSTAERPKQFLPLAGDKSLFHSTLERVSDRETYYPPVVVANISHRDLCLEELAGSSGGRLILEPCARNTAAAIVMAAEVVREAYGPEQVMLVMPSDHVIGNASSFHAAVAQGLAASAAGRLVTFGVTPTGPETGYGYLEAGPAIESAPGAFEVERFTEKPVLAKAKEMVATGRHYWNGGIFMFRAGDFLEEARRHAPDIHETSVRAVARAERMGESIIPQLSELEPCPNVSVDYAVMERSDRVAMVPLDADWSDVGSWDALAEVAPQVSGEAGATTINSNNCYVRTDGIKVALLGVDDLIVVASSEHVLVMRKGCSQDIRQLVARIAAEN